MPALLAEDPATVLQRTPGHLIAFIFLCKRAVFDYEDPYVARQFLISCSADAGSKENTQSRSCGFWSALPCRLAIETLLCAGAPAACRATATSHAWRHSAVAQGIRDKIYAMATGSSFPGCSAEELAIALKICQLVRYATRPSGSGQHPATLTGNWPPQGSRLEAVHTQKPVSLPAACVAVFLDDGAIFAVLRNGELRCHRADSGHLLGTAQGKKGTKRRGTTCAVLFNREAFIIGDEGGGLTFIRRDDLSETFQIRKESSAAVCSLTQLDSTHIVAMHVNGTLDVVRFSVAALGAASNLSISVSMKLSSVLSPALGVLTDGKSQILLAATDTSLWSWQEGLEAPVQAVGDVLLPREISSEDIGGRCHLVTVSPRSCPSETLVLTASSLSAKLHWWSLEELNMVLVDCCTTLDGGVISLASCQGFVLSLHTNGISLLHGPLHGTALRIDPISVLPTCVCFDDGCLVLGGQSGFPAGFLWFASFGRRLDTEERKSKEPRKTKAPKMFANKSRGGRKNQFRAVGKIG